MRLAGRASERRCHACAVASLQAQSSALILAEGVRQFGAEGRARAVQRWLLVWRASARHAALRRLVKEELAQLVTAYC